MLGTHWILDGFDCDPARLRDRDVLREAIVGLPAFLGLTRVGEPQLFEHLDPDEPEPMLAGMTLIAESHFSLHARPSIGALHADLFSCRPFDQAAARAWLQRHFRIGRCQEQLIARGAGEPA